jgi:4'-phosphopantetheinyl transferase
LTAHGSRNSIAPLGEALETTGAVRAWRDCADVPSNPGRGRATVLLVEVASFGGDSEAALSVEERERADRLLDAAARRRFVVGRAILRHALGRHLGCPPEAILLGSGAQGKPELAGPSESSRLRFNLSHSGGVVLLGLSARGAIGVDVEQVRDGVDVMAIAARFLGSAQRDALARLAPADRTRRFFETWTMREALLKAAGVGLTGLDALEAQSLHIPAGARHASAVLEGVEWRATPLPSFDGHVAAVAEPAPGSAPDCWHWRPA